MNAKKIGLGLLDAAVKILFVVIVVVLIMKYARVAYSYGYGIFNQTPVSTGAGRTISFTVAESDSVNNIADKLAAVGLITDKTLFKLQEQFSEYHGMEKPGTYELSTAMKPEEMLAIMAGSSDETGESSGSGESQSTGESGSSDSAGEESSGG